MTHHRTTGAFTLTCVLAWAAGAFGQDLPELGEPFETDPAEPFVYDGAGWDISTATTGDTLLVVQEEGGQIRGMIADLDGQPQSTSMLALDSLAPEGSRYYPSVAAGGGRYLIGWTGEGVAAQLAESDGTLVSSPIVLDSSGYYPAITWNGTEFLVAWMGMTDAGRDIMVARVDTTGNVVGTEQLTTTGDATEPWIVSAGSTSLVSWYSNPATASTGVQAALVGPSAELLAPGVFRVSTDDTGYDVRATSDGEAYFVAWSETSTPYALQGRVVGADGALGSELAIATGDSSMEPVLGFDGQRYSVLWEQAGAKYVQRVSTAGSLDGTFSTLDYVPVNTGKSPSLLWTGSSYWFVYPGEGLFGVFADSDLNAQSDPVGLSLVPHPQDGATVLFDGNGYVITWTDEREGSMIFSSHAVRVDQSGTVLDTEAIHLSTPEDRGSYVVAATAQAGTTVTAWLWQDGDGGFLRTLSSNGTVTATTTLTDLPINSVSLASDGSGYMAVFVVTTSDSSQYTAMAQPLDASGAPIGEPVTLRTQAAYLTAGVHAVADGYLVLYRDTDSFLMAIDSDGIPGEPQLLAAGSVSLQTATNGSDSLLVWNEGAANTRYGRLYSNGTWVGERFVIAEDGRWGDTVWDGTRFVDVWQTADYFAQMRAIEVDGAMTPAASLFADEECNGPKLGSNNEGQLLLSCVRYMDEFRTRRLVNYLMGSPTTPPTTDPPADSDAGASDAGTGGGTHAVDAATQIPEADAANVDGGTLSPEAGSDAGEVDAATAAPVTGSAGTATAAPVTGSAGTATAGPDTSEQEPAAGGSTGTTAATQPEDSDDDPENRATGSAGAPNQTPASTSPRSVSGCELSGPVPSGQIPLSPVGMLLAGLLWAVRRARRDTR